MEISAPKQSISCIRWSCGIAKAAAVPVDEAARLFRRQEPAIPLVFFPTSPNTCSRRLYMHTYSANRLKWLPAHLFSLLFVVPATEVKLVSAYPRPVLSPCGRGNSFESAHTLPGSEVHPNKASKVPQKAFILCLAAQAANSLTSAGLLRRSSDHGSGL